jgi:hypothetical protein
MMNWEFKIQIDKDMRIVVKEKDLSMWDIRFGCRYR